MRRRWSKVLTALCTYRDRYFDGGYFLPGNEPSFETPWLYHYANRPDLSARRVRKVVYENFGTGVEGVGYSINYQRGTVLMTALDSWQRW